MKDKKQLCANNFYYKLNEQGEAIITGAEVWPEVLIIPEQLDGYTVVEIGGSAFDTDIVYHEKLSLEKAENRCIYEDRIKEVQLPETIRSIGACAFYQCNSLHKINFPKSLRWIDSLAFANAWELEEIRLPKGCELYWEDTFTSDSRLAVFEEQGAFEGVRGFIDDENGGVPEDGVEIEYY